MPLTFKSSFDTVSKMITGIGFLLLIYIGYDLYSDPHSSTAGLVYIAVVLITNFAAFFLNSGTFVVKSDCLVIDRAVGGIKIPFDDILSTRVLNDGDSYLIRTFGIGGYGGWYGKFWSRTTGVVTMYGRNQQHRILLKTKTHGSLIITPDDLSILSHLPTSKP
ncbi:MAG TPA: PH domain-containing protein [Candidatus Kapabacteria bacterium]|nr:PH domain-containing protein [Candidatus Kapabacteria bacterium]